MEFMMEKEKFEEMLSELLTPDLEQSRKSEILQEFRTNYNATISGVTEIVEQNKKLVHDNDDLVVANSKLFRQLGVTSTDGENEQVDEKEFSETVTLEDLE